jgi:apolipoprotein N-acyltransferase
MSLSDFFATAAQVTAGLLIALVIDAWRKDPTPEREARRAGVYFILLGLTATLIAMLPWSHSDDWVTFGMFPIVVGCLGASVAAFLSIASDASHVFSESESGIRDPHAED